MIVISPIKKWYANLPPQKDKSKKNTTTSRPPKIFHLKIFPNRNPLHLPCPPTKHNKLNKSTGGKTKEQVLDVTCKLQTWWRISEPLCPQVGSCNMWTPPKRGNFHEKSFYLPFATATPSVSLGGFQNSLFSFREGKHISELVELVSKKRMIPEW